MAQHPARETRIPDDLLSSRELAERRGVTTHHIDWLRDSGQLPFYRLGKRKVMVSLAEFDALFTRVEGHVSPGVVRNSDPARPRTKNGGAEP